jgi:flavin reductase (DIM6/NTAB) family NADH-FMN oxidoreductase RutF
MSKLFVTRRFMRSSPTVAGVIDRRQVHFHFRPVRPADIVVSLDPHSGEVNLAAGTYGVISRNPLTIGIHIHRDSYDSMRNVSEHGPGTELVIALPGRDIVYQTWITSLPIPRGINEGEVGRLHFFSSHHVAPPSIVECPLNLEAVTAKVIQYGIHHIVFCRVLGASITEEMLGHPREELVRAYPTHECDDIDNPWKGAVERLSVLGEVIPCPPYPCGPREGTEGSIGSWFRQLAEDGLVSASGLDRLLMWAATWEAVAADVMAPDRAELRRKLSRAVELAAWEEFDALQAFLDAGGEEATQ